MLVWTGTNSEKVYHLRFMENDKEEAEAIRILNELEEHKQILETYKQVEEDMEEVKNMGVMAWLKKTFRRTK